MIYVFLMYAITVGVVIYAVRSPAFRLQAVEGWQSLHKVATVKLAVLSGSLSLLPSTAQQLLDLAPQLQAIEGVPALTEFLHGDLYRKIVGYLTLLIVVARYVKQPPKATS